jgi:cytochrome d ubiquinol oxidase subunit I
MMIASGLTVSFLLAGISAYRWLKKYVSDAVMATMRAGVFVAAVLIPVQIFVGDLHGLNTLEHQPAKLAAMEGIWKTQKGVPAVLFALPDEKSKTNNFEIAIPNLASLYLTHHWDGEVLGLDAFEGKHPPVAPVFWAFRVMVGIGLLMLVVSWWATFELRIKRRPSQMIAKILVAMTFAGWVALIAGWYVTEIGRQPWLVYGLLTVAQAASTVPATSIALTLTIYLLLYILLLGAYISVVFYLAKKAIQPAPKRDQKEVLSAKVNFTELKNV